VITHAAPRAPAPSSSNQHSTTPDTVAAPEFSRTAVVVGSILVFGGVALATYLLGLKVARLPCGVGNCDAIIRSSYGSILGVPVSLFAIAAWGLLVYSSGWLRLLAAAALFVGSLWFVAVQAFILQSFCILCCAHAACAIGGAFILHARKSAPHWFALGAMAGWIGLVAWERSAPDAGFFTDGATSVAASPLGAFTKAHVSSVVPAKSGAVVSNPAQTPGAAVGKLERTARDFPGFAWFGTTTDQSSLLVLSLTCGHCVDEIEKVLDQMKTAKPKLAPKIMILSSGANIPIHRVVLAAIISASKQHGETAGFARVMDVLRPHRDDMMGGKEDRIRDVLNRAGVSYSDTLGEADELIQRHHQLLQSINVRGTPYVLTSTGAGRYGVEKTQF
jgi:uncharacterized membrane protein